MTAPADNHAMNAHRRGVLLTFTLVGAFFAIAGLALRLAANLLSKRIVRSGYESDFAAWRDALGGCGTLIATFGMLMILLTQKQSPRHTALQTGYRLTHKIATSNFNTVYGAIDSNGRELIIKESRPP